MHLFMISLGGFEQTTLNFSAIQKYDFLHQYYQALGQLLTDIDGQIQRVIAETVVVCLPDEYTETSSLMWLVVILQE